MESRRGEAGSSDGSQVSVEKVESERKLTCWAGRREEGTPQPLG